MGATTSNLSDVQFPDWAQFLFKPYRYKIAEGGRGSSKSWSFARGLILCAYHQVERILCTRELQTSIAESVHHLLEEQIWLMGLASYFEVQQNFIRRRPWSVEDPGSEFFFYGLRQNTTKVKSTEGVTKCWVEEAEKVSSESWEILIPTIRAPNSEIWVTFNPDEENDPTYQRFVVNTPPNAYVAKVNWHQNPWFPEELRREKDYLYRVDAEAAEHVWGGECRKNSSSQIFRGKYIVEEFVPPVPSECTADSPMWEGPYYGADWGFSQDPTVLDKSWVDVKNRRLMVEKEAWKVGLELDDTAPFFKRNIPECASGVIRADSARPETISYIGRVGGLQIRPAEKWKGSVEDGIAYLRKFEQIVFHPRCAHSIQEARLYSYKVDRLTGDVLADVVDKHNHGWDARRYAHEPMITRGGNLSIWAKLAG